MIMRNLQLKFLYSSDSDDFVESFYNPCLKNSDTYYRAVGFFNSSIFKDIHDGLQEFIIKGGKIKLICSPNLSQDDIDKIEQGYNKRDIIKDHLISLIKSSEPEDYSEISWLIKHEFLDIKIVVGLWDKEMLYHEKYGLFFKDDDYIAFWGSSNESHNAVRKNYESFTVMNSWQNPDECENFLNKFNTIWSGENNLLETYDFPEAVKNELIKVYNPGTFSPGSSNKWKFQEDAIQKFIDNEYKLLYEMATGTGKTRTALKTIKKVYEGNDKIIPIILVNQVDLMYQWGENVKDFLGITPIYVGDGNDYQSQIENYIYTRKLNIDELNIVIAIDKSYRTHFQRYVGSFDLDDIFLIYDEAHNITTNILSDLPQCKHRLGLTATLERPSEVEVENIRDYFGNRKFEFGIDKAIKLGVLTQYDYNIELVEMNQDEYERFSRYSLQMVSTYNNKDMSSMEKDRILKELAQKRALIIKKMENKVDSLVSLLKKKSDINKTVVYCGSGKNIDGNRIIEDITMRISNEVNSRLKMSHYTYHEAAQRPLILEFFKDGFYDLLLAIKCLDEGVDIPMLQHLYILASDKSTKQTVQRRGRVMRSFDDKAKCYITDFIAIPPHGINDGFSHSLLSVEMPRIEEYNSIALNKKQNIFMIQELKDKYMKGEQNE